MWCQVTGKQLWAIMFHVNQLNGYLNLIFININSVEAENKFITLTVSAKGRESLQKGIDVVLSDT